MEISIILIALFNLLFYCEHNAVKKHISDLDTIALVQHKDTNSINTTIVYEHILSDQIEQYLENVEEEEINIETYQEYIENPIKINNIGYTELEELGLLSPWEIESIIRYREDYGPLLGAHELEYIPNFPKQKAKLLEPLVLFSPPDGKSYLKDVLKNGKHEICLKYNRSLSRSKAYINNIYSGSPNSFAVRYRLRCKEMMQIGLAMEKDAGENKFPDSWSAFIAFQNTGIVEKWIIGSFSLNFGYGLHIGGGLFSNNMDPEIISRSGNGLKPYASLGEQGYFSGSALNIKCSPNTTLTLFYSYRALDASSIGYDSLQSLSFTGYHRSENEKKKKRQGILNVVGLALEHKFKTAKAGMTFSYSHLNKPYFPKVSTYNRFSVLSQDVIGGSFYYQALYRKLHFYGEFAWSGVLNRKNNWSAAFLQGLQWKAHPAFLIGGYFRYYPISYSGFFVKAPGRNSSGNNELGLYIGAKWYISSKLKLDLEFDWSQKAWYSYPSTFPCTNFLYGLRFSYIHKNTELYFYYRYKGNSISDKNNYRQHLLRLNFAFNAFSGLILRSRIELKNFTKGYLLYQDIGYNFNKIGLTLRFRYALFQTQSFEERFYVYESDLLYTSTFPVYYGRGQRFYLLIRYKPVKFMSIEAKYSHTLYDHTSYFGSGENETRGYLKPDIRLQLRFSF